MASRGFLIRFIDIGLIVLFGFVMLSDIDVLSQVALSTADDAPSEEVESDRALVTVAIDVDGAFTVTDIESGSVVARALMGTDALARVLRRMRDEAAAEARATVVLIQPDDNSTVQRTVDVMDVCDRLGIGKSLHTTAPAEGA